MISRRNDRRFCSVLLAAAGLALGATPATAAGNDDFADATAVTAPWTNAQDTAGATLEAGEPQPSCSTATGATVWYSVTVPTHSVLDVSTFGSKFDTVVAAYTGSSIDALTEIACNDDAEDVGSAQSRLTVDPEDMPVVLLQVGGWNGASGSLKISVQPASVGDNFARPFKVKTLPFSMTVDNSTATVESGERGPCWEDPNYTMWFRYTATEPVVLEIDTAGSEADVVVGVWEGSSLQGLDQVACSYSWEDPLNVGVGAGQTYSIQVSTDWEGNFGLFTLSIKGGELPPPPANDEVAAAAEIGLPSTTDVNTEGATTGDEEPDPCYTGVGRTVWYRFTADATEAVVLSTRNSNFDTVLAVFEGTSPEDLDPVACDDDGGYAATSSLGLTVNQGATYWIQLGGYSGDWGDASLRFFRGTAIDTDTPFVGAYVTVENEPGDPDVEACVSAVITTICR